MDKISVIMPVYKVEKYLKECMDSVLNQTYKNLEIILVDDGSPDRCGELCDEYAKKDSRIQVIHKKNGGAPAARNDALAIATGEWIAYVDPDDWVETNAFEIALAAAQKEQADIVIFNTYLNQDDGSQSAIQAFPHDFVTNNRKIIYGMQLSALNSGYTPYSQNWSQGFPWDKIYRTSQMRAHNVLWPVNLKANDDVVYTIHAFQAARKIAYVDKTLYHYRMNPASIGHKYTPDRIEIEEKIIDEMLNIQRSYGFDERYSKALYARIVTNTWYNCIRCFFHQDNHESLKEKFKKIDRMLHKEIYKTAFEEVERDHLHDTGARLISVFKHPKAIWFYCIYLLNKAKDFFRRR